jgi:hypothetical protein
MDFERVALPAADGLVRLERVVQDGLRPVLGLDDDVGLGEPAVEVATLVLTLVVERLRPNGLVGVEERLEHLPRDVDQLDGCLRLGEAVGGHGRNGMTRVGRLVREHVALPGPDDGVHSRRRRCA